jgi:hypothetical protein
MRMGMRRFTQCGFIGTNGRCNERGFLECHHVIPYASGGATTAVNLQLRCRAHNAYESEQYFGTTWVREKADDSWPFELGPDRAGLNATFGSESSKPGGTERDPREGVPQAVSGSPSLTRQQPIADFSALVSKGRLRSQREEKLCSAYW